jgi:glycosyltransferase involved in cell wall biosynthesis
MPKLGATTRDKTPLRGVRVVVDARPIQEPDRSPLTAEYLDRLLHAFAAEPLADESFVVITRALRPDPTDDLEAAGLPVAARRVIPPTTRAFRSAGLTLDSFLLRGAEFGATSVGGVFHTAGGAVPLASRLPIVATLLDLAPWELPSIYASSAAARFGHRLRARVLQDATRVIVCSRASAESASRQLHLPAERIAVVPLAVDDGFVAVGRQQELIDEARQRLALPERYLVFSGRYDARKDLTTLFEALKVVRDRPAAGTRGRSGGRTRTRAAPPAASVPESEAAPRPPGPLSFVFVAPQTPAADEAVIRRAISRHGVDDIARVVVTNTSAERAHVIAAAEAFVYPALSEATALPALEALSLGIPVICTRAGALPEVVGSAGIVVAPKDAPRLAAAIEAVWDGGSLADQLKRQAQKRAESTTRTWADVARETRQVYAAAAAAKPG